MRPERKILKRKTKKHIRDVYKNPIITQDESAGISGSLKK